MGSKSVNDSMPQIGGTPYKTPQVRRKLPAPFSRPLIDLDGAGRIKRAWQDVSVLDVKTGDTVANFGSVSKVESWVERDPYQWKVKLFNVMGDFTMFTGEQRVFAFTAEQS